MTYRVLVTGSRNWTDVPFMLERLNEAYYAAGDQPVVLVHGCAAGADTIAHRWATSLQHQQVPVEIEMHRADWTTNGKRAGVIRNAEMVAAGADLCLAFIREHSNGASHCARIAEKAGIETRIYRWEDIHA